MGRGRTKLSPQPQTVVPLDEPLVNPNYFPVCPHSRSHNDSWVKSSRNILTASINDNMKGTFSAPSQWRRLSAASPSSTGPQPQTATCIYQAAIRADPARPKQTSLQSLSSFGLCSSRFSTSLLVLHYNTRMTADYWLLTIETRSKHLKQDETLPCPHLHHDLNSTSLCRSANKVCSQQQISAIKHTSWPLFHILMRLYHQ